MTALIAWIEDPDIVEIALAGTPAVPQAKFAIMKTMTPPDGQEVIIKTVPFFKDEVKKRIFGYIAVPDKVDLQGEAMTAENVEKACHSYMKNGFFGGAKGVGVTKDHIKVEGLSHPIESCIDKGGALMKAYGKEDEAIDGAWFYGMQLDDEAWDQVQKGVFTGYSMGGFGLKNPVDDAPVAKEQNAFQKMVTKVTSLLIKAEGDAMTFNEVDLMDTVHNELWKKLEQLHFSISTIVTDPEVPNKQAAIGASIDQFRASLLGALVVAKAGKEISAANMKLIQDAMTAFGGLQELMERINAASTQKAITKGDGTMAHTLDTLGAAIEKLTKKIDEDVLPVLGEFEEFKKAQDAAAEAGSTKNDKEPTELEKALDAAFEKNVKPISDKLDAMDTRLKKVEDTPGDPNGNPNDKGDDEPTTPPVAKTAEERVELEKAKVAAIGDKMLFGRPETKG